MNDDLLVILTPFQPKETVMFSDFICTLDLTLTSRHVFKLFTSMKADYMNSHGKQKLSYGEVLSLGKGVERSHFLVECKKFPSFEVLLLESISISNDVFTEL